MIPSSNSEAEINVWCDYLTDNDHPFADEIRFEDYSVNGWTYECKLESIIIARNGHWVYDDKVGTDNYHENMVTRMSQTYMLGKGRHVGSYDRGDDVGPVNVPESNDVGGGD